MPFTNDYIEGNRVILSEEIASYYQHLFTYIPKARHLILHSGRGTTKSTFFSMYDLWRLLQTPHADGFVIAYEYQSILDKVFQDYVFAAFLLKIPRQHIEFHATKNGEAWIKIRNKWGVNKIWFEHGKMGSESFKGRRPTEHNKWLFVRFYELTNFIGWNPRELENTIATFIRASYSRTLWDKIELYCNSHGYAFVKNEKWLLDQPWFYQDNNWDNFKSHEFCVEYEFNTPAGTESSGGWVLDWLDVKRKQSNVWYQFNNYLDMSTKEKYKFLGQDALDEIEGLKLSDPITYNHVYLGKMPWDGDICYPNLNYNIHFGEHENFNPDTLVIGVDVGRSDATVITLSGFEWKGKDLRIQQGIHCWSHCNRRSEYIKDGVKLPYRSFDINDYATMILQFCDMVHEEYPSYRIYFQMDRKTSGGKDFYDACFRYKDPDYLIINRLWKTPDVPKRIDGIWTALTIPGILKIKDPLIYQAYKNQVWDKKRSKETGERIRLDDPSKLSMRMDHIDANEYSWLPEFWDMFTNRIRKSKGKYSSKIRPISVHNWN